MVVRCHMLALMLAVVPVVAGRTGQVVCPAAYTRSPACAGPSRGARSCVVEGHLRLLS
jgi:hypothetical protein